MSDLIVLIALGVASYLVYQDALKHGKSKGESALWAAGTFLLVIFVMPLWFLYGRKNTASVNTSGTGNAVRLCKECGKYFEGSPAFCPNCGARVEQNSAGNNPTFSNTQQNKGMNRNMATSATIDSVISEIKSTYSGHERLDEMITDLSDGESLYGYWGTAFCSSEFGNKALGKKLFQLAANTVEDADDILVCANGIAGSDGLNDKEWGRQLYAKYQEQMDRDALGSYVEFIGALKNELGDDVWAKQITQEGFQQLEQCDDITEFAGAAYNVVLFLEFIDSEDQKAVIYEKLKGFEDTSDLIDIARMAHEGYKNQAGLNLQYLNEILQKAIDNVAEGSYCEVFNFINDELNDPDAAEDFKQQHFDELKQESVEYGSYDDIFGTKKNTSPSAETGREKLIRMTVIATGGEFTAGVVNDSSVIEQLKTKISEGSLNTFMEFDDDTHFEASNYTDILQAYGPNVPESDIKIELTYDVDADDDDREYEDISFSQIDDTEIVQFTSANPNPEAHYENYDDDDLVFYSQKIEKRIHYPALIYIAGDAEFELSNVYIGSMDMDETFGGDAILQYVLYIPSESAQQYMQEFFGDEYSGDESLQDYISEIFMEREEIKQKILANHLVETGNVEGKGEWENDYVRVTMSNGDVLFEDGAL